MRNDLPVIESTTLLSKQLNGGVKLKVKS